MKAWVLHGINDLRYETVDNPSISDEEVLISIKAAGICGSDIPRIYKTGAHTHPIIPGHEMSGVVTKTGANVDKAWQEARVGIFPLIPCGRCALCQKLQYEMCRHYSFLGSRRDGGFAEYAAVPVGNLIRIPDSITFEEAAMLEPMAVAVHAMRKMNLTSVDTVTVCGLGTIGLLLVMFLKDAGIKNILVIGNKDFQKNMSSHLGIDAVNYCDSNTQSVYDWTMERTDGMGTDVFFECVGKNDTFIQSINCTAPAGRICLVGNPYSDMDLEREVYWKILRKQLTVMGVWNSSFTKCENDDWNYALERMAGKRIKPAKLITHRFALEELEKGLHIMRDKTEDYIKVMGVLD